jgi:FG-GAP repeat
MSTTHLSPLAVHRLEDRFTPAATDLIVTGSGAGSRPLVQLYRPDGTIRSEFFAYDPRFTGGVNVAYADVNADGVKDVIAAAGAGGGPHVKVFDGVSLGNLFDPSQPHPAVVVPLTELYSFFAYAGNFNGGVSVAAGDVNGDGYDDVITGAGPGGGPHVRAFSGKTGGELHSFYAFDSRFGGGVNVAAGHLTREITASPSNPERADILVGSGPGMRATVVGFDGRSGEQFFQLNPYGGFGGGVSVAAGDLNADGYDDVITGAGFGGGPHVTAYDGMILANLPVILLPAGGPQPIASFFAFDSAFVGGVRVAATDLTGDGLDEIVTGAGPTGVPVIRAFGNRGATTVREFIKFGYTPSAAEYYAGVTVG